VLEHSVFYDGSFLGHIAVAGHHVFDGQARIGGFVIDAQSGIEDFLAHVVRKSAAVGEQTGRAKLLADQAVQQFSRHEGTEQHLASKVLRNRLGEGLLGDLAHQLSGEIVVQQGIIQFARLKAGVVEGGHLLALFGRKHRREAVVTPILAKIHPVAVEELIAGPGVGQNGIVIDAGIILSHRLVEFLQPLHDQVRVHLHGTVREGLRLLIG